MHLALLCDDPAVLPWLDTLATDSEHEVTLAATLSAAASALLRGRSGIRLTPHWEELVGQTSFDVVLAGGSDHMALEAIKQLATSGQSLLFLPNAEQGSTFIYELSLIRDDNHVDIYPAMWHRCDPVLVELRSSLRSGSGGAVQLLQLQREFDSTSSNGTIPQPDIDAALLFDFDLLRWLIGDYDQVTALRTGQTELGLRTQSVKLSGRGLPEATWDASTGKTSSRRLTIHTDRGVTTLQLDAAGDWTRTAADGQVTTGSSKAAVREFLRQVEAKSSPVEWTDLIRVFETVDATHRSVTRRRTIDLHFEPMSERAIFKTQMTAIGCSVLIATFVLVLIYLAIASAVSLPPLVLIILRVLVFTPLGIFLMLQLLYPLTRTSERAEPRDAN